MRLAYVHEVALPGAAANTVHVVKMCDAFARNGIDVSLITPGALSIDPARRARICRYYGVSPAVTLRHFPKPGLPGGQRLFARLAVRCAKSRQADLVYSRHVRSCLVAARQGLPTIFETHVALDDFTPSRRKVFLALAEEPAFRRLIVISNALRDAFLEDLATLERKIVVAPDGADDPFIATGGRDKEPSDVSARDRLDVGYVGHLYPGKGMEIIAALVPLCPWADFHVVGGEASDVEHWRKTLSACANIRFLGHRPHVEVSAHIRRFDVVLAPYGRVVQGRKNGLDLARWMSPLKIFEYMAHGKAIVSSDLPVLREVLTDGETALLCDPDNIESWCAALASLHVDPALRRRLGTKARMAFMAAHSWTRRAERVLDGVWPGRWQAGARLTPLSVDPALDYRSRRDQEAI